MNFPKSLVLKRVNEACKKSVGSLSCFSPAIFTYFGLKFNFRIYSIKTVFKNLNLYFPKCAVCAHVWIH